MATDDAKVMKIEEERVSPQSACPKCGERRIVYLAWQDDENVRCCKCGKVYQPE